jgi:glucokinase-like ROK family protein
MKKTGDLLLMKKINQSIVLDLIRRERPISRAAIAQKTGLTKATVSSQVQELIDSHLAEELGVGISSGGRKPVMLTFNPRAGFAIGIDLGVHTLLAVLTDLDGTVVERRQHTYENTRESEVMPLLIRCIEELRQLAPSAPYGIVGIGLGVPGIIRHDGTVLLAPNLGWTEVSLKDKLEKAVGIPITIDNEANVGAVGEKEYGVGKAYANQIYVSLGVGIGTGIILNHQLYRGSMGYSGEMGHTTIDIHGRKCSCGNIGCWETYASESALLKSASKPDAWGTEPLPRDIDQFSAAAKMGYPPALTILQEMGAYLAIGLANMIHTFNPELVVIGARMPDIQRWVEPSMREEFKRRLLSYHDEKLRLEFSSLGADAAVLGAVTLAISRFLGDFRVTINV